MSYRVVVSREEPWWVAEVFGDGLPDHGAATQARTLDGLDEMVRDLVATWRDLDDDMAQHLDLSYAYDLPEPAASALADWQASRRELTEAEERYYSRMEQAARILGDTVHASLRDAAELMGVSAQRVQQVRAGKTRRRHSRAAA